MQAPSAAGESTHNHNKSSNQSGTTSQLHSHKLRRREVHPTSEAKIDADFH